MPTRRGFLGGFLATGLVPQATWGDIGGPAFLSAAQMPDGSYRLFGLSADGGAMFSLPLPGRGHAGIAHPEAAEAVVFARRPGIFAQVIDCATGRGISQLQTPKGRHFYGHGVFSADGRYLFTPENDYEAGLGVIGTWDRARNYARTGEFPSGGTGPHEISRLPGTNILVVANGGIETHPDSGRSKLNLATMQPNLSYLSSRGELLETVELSPEMRLNSIRHLSVRTDGLVAFGMQWQGDRASSLPLLGFHRRGQKGQLAKGTDIRVDQMKGYAGSVVFSRSGAQVAVSSPRGGSVQLFDTKSLTLATSYRATDVCGIGVGGGQDVFILTTGTGAIITLNTGLESARAYHEVNWDNHVVPVR